MDLELAGKIALVTGSSKGIGEAIANRLAAEGAVVIVHGRDRETAERAARNITENGGRAFVVVGDIGSDDGVAKVVEMALKHVEHVDILVNNAGGSGEPVSWSDASLEHWRSSLQRNLLAAVGFSALLLPAMRERCWGRVVNIASGAALMPPAANPDYSAAKAAIIAMTSSMSKAVGCDGVTVNAISPGTIHSDKLDRKFRETAAEQGCGRDASWEKVERHVLPLIGVVSAGRVGTLEEMADVVAFLCSPLAGYVTGVNLRVDGGMFAGI